MQSIKFLRGAGDLFLEVKLDEKDNNVQVKKIMGENELRLSFKLNRHAAFLINDYVDVFGEIYKLNDLPAEKKKSDLFYEYTVVLKSEGQDLAKANYMFLGDDNSLKETDFSLIGTAETFVDLALQNVERVSSGFVKGQIIPTGYKTLSFSRENCYNALPRIAEEFKTEFAVEGKTIHITKRSYDTGYTFRQGQHKGLYDLTRLNVDGSSIVTRLYAYGSEKNLPGSYRNFSTRLKMPSVDFVEENVNVYGVIEAAMIFDEVYPHRRGKISSVNAADIFQFIDADIDFNLSDYFLPGLPPKVAFLTGQLAGYEFEIVKYNHDSRLITILKNKDERAMEVPSQSLKPAIGDEYTLIDMTLPQEYIDKAEIELADKAAATLAQISHPQVTYQLNFDPVYLRRKKYQIKIGDLVWLQDAALGVQRKIRITATTRDIVQEYKFSVELSDVLQASTISRLVNTTQVQGREISEVRGAIANNSLLNGYGIYPVWPGGPGAVHLLIEVATGKIFRQQ